MEMDVSNEGERGAEIKRQFHDRNPRRIKAFKFGVLSSQDIVSQSVVDVFDRHLYDITDHSRPVTAHGPLDLRLGTSSNAEHCHTCGEPLKNCNGHFGHVKLALPVFHVGFMRKIIEILHCICKECASVLLTEESKRSFLRSFRRQNLDGLQLKQITKKVIVECRKRKECPHCGAVNGVVKKVPGNPLKVVHEKYKWYFQSNAKSKVMPPSLVEFNKSFEEAKKTNFELEKHLRKAVDDLNPLTVLELFRRITDSDCEVLGMKSGNSRPEMLVWQYLPAPPVSIRPSVHQDAASTEDDLTNKLGDIIHVSSIIKDGIVKGQPIQTIMEQWDYLQIQVAMYINSDTPNLLQSGFGRPIRSLVQRIKGKQGRFRGNLSGKRVDFSARTVISPDPNLAIDEVAVPEREAVNLTYPDRVTAHNIEKLKRCVERGKKYPGANFIVKKDSGRRLALAVFANKGSEKLRSVADRLQIGDIVHRHLEDGDIVLFNRQPSLHKLSIMCHRVQVKQWRTFSLNECVCTPYNADFDGDEMNLHVPQTDEARAEALELMSVKRNLATPKDGTPIIAATQDFITAGYLLSNKDRFYDRKSFAQICNYMFDGQGTVNGAPKRYQVKEGEHEEVFDIQLPHPAILKPQKLWTGKQVFSVLMRPSLKSDVKLNFDATCKQYRPDPANPRDLNENDHYVCIRNSEIMTGMMDKAILGSGNKDSIFYVMMRDYGPDHAVQAMSRMAKLSARWLTNEGFSIGISDIFPGTKLQSEKDSLIAEAYRQCESFIKACANGSLLRDAGCDLEQTMENKITGKLNEVRQRSGELCFERLSKWNAAVTMAKSGSKGSNINVAQMVATVGQQIINLVRVADGFESRTLPHFPKSAREPPSKGFVSNSFFSGLSPTEFIFHAMSGREGLVDTAVKTADTGYMSRRLLKSLEDLSCYYDDTIRNSTAAIVQFQYGDDRLDPVDMEGKAKPVNLERTFIHAQASEWDVSEPSMLPFEIIQHTANILVKRRKLLERVGLNGTELPYRLAEGDMLEVDQFESSRRFLDEVENFIAEKAEALAQAREYVALLPARKKVGKVKWKDVDKVKQIGLAHGTTKISQKSLDKFLELCLSKYEKSKVQPGTPVGAVGAQSISEPGTQMTLKTFHFAGVAGMSITQGVPRIREIINASKFISTPVISCELHNPMEEQAARMVKGQIEKTYLKDVISWMSECWDPMRNYLRIKVNFETIADLQLNLSMLDIRRALSKARGLQLDERAIKIEGPILSIELDESFSEKRSNNKNNSKNKDEEHFIRLQNLKRQLPTVVVKGYPNATRAVIAKKLKQDSEGKRLNEILVEGYGLKECMITDGVDGHRTRTNSVIEAKEVLGIEAARSTIIEELNSVMGTQMDIDPRHMQLLADVMTYKGDVLGITRFGLAKMRDSVLQLASFERTPDHLFEAAIHGKEDKIEGVSECIIMGQGMRVGTGAMQLVRSLGLGAADFTRKPTLFEDAFKSRQGGP